MKDLRKGYSLLEVMLAIVLSVALISAIVILNAPFTQQFSDAFVFQRLRQGVNHPMDALTQEIKGARAAYVDSNLCYALCLVEKATGNRVYYYWSGNDLLRKSESGTITSPITCTGGTVFAKGMDLTNSGITHLKDLVTVKLAMTGAHNTSFPLWTSIFPTNTERVEPLYDGFACNSTTGKGWNLSSGTANWAIQTAASGTAAYWLYETLTANQATAVTGSAEIPVNLGRISSAYLRFKYRVSGTMGSGENLSVNYYDGASWTQVFLDDLGGAVSPLTMTTVDLSSYALNANSKIRIDGLLKNKNNHWIIDEISIVAK